MKTAALLPASGSPEIARYWLRNYEGVWRDEVDELLVLVNGDTASVGLYRAAGARVQAVPWRMGHGEALNALLSSCDADAVVLIEDDAFVREPGAIRARLERTLQGEVIGTPRRGMSPELETAAEAKWGPVVGPDTSSGHGLWPCFLFAPTAVLRECGGFEGMRSPAGSVVPGLDYRVREDADTDTASALAFRLRARGPITPDVQHKELWQKNLPPEGAPYFHAGGFSTLDQLPREGCGGTNEGLDWSHRAWWWNRIGIDVSEHVRIGGLEEQVRGWDDVLEPWINWDEGER